MGDQPVARPLPTHRITQTEFMHTAIHTASGIRSHDRCVWAGEHSSCHRPSGHCDTQTRHKKRNVKQHIISFSVSPPPPYTTNTTFQTLPLTVFILDILYSKIISMLIFGKRIHSVIQFCNNVFYLCNCRDLMMVSRLDDVTNGKLKLFTLYALHSTHALSRWFCSAHWHE
jgi:hypothetical protein